MTQGFLAKTPVQFSVWRHKRASSCNSPALPAEQLWSPPILPDKCANDCKELRKVKAQLSPVQSNGSGSLTLTVPPALPLGDVFQERKTKKMKTINSPAFISVLPSLHRGTRIYTWHGTGKDKSTGTVAPFFLNPASEVRGKGCAEISPKVEWEWWAFKCKDLNKDWALQNEGYKTQQQVEEHFHQQGLNSWENTTLSSPSVYLQCLMRFSSLPVMVMQFKHSLKVMHC